MLRLVSAIICCLYLVSCTGETERILPSKTTITESVYSSVTIQPDSLYHAYAIVSGILDQNLVREGDIVYKGTPLLQIGNSSPKLNAENAKLSLNLIKKNYKGSTAILNSIKEEIKAASLKTVDDSINYLRQKKLWDQKIGSKVIFDTKKLTYELSSNSLKLLKIKYYQTKEELETQLKQAENIYKTSMITAEDFTVNSKIDGKVYALYKNKGEIINPQEPLAAIGSTDIFIVKMLVDEVDIIKIKKGQKVLLTLDAYSNMVFNARVSKIYPQKDERNQTFMVEALFDQSPEVLYPGLSGEANIIIDIKKEALTIPKQYLIDHNKVQTDLDIIEVVVGIQSMDSIEIISGITEKTWIYKPK